MKPIARITAIYRYPVKGMRGEELQSAQLGWHGLEGDRRFAFMEREDRSGFPWATGRVAPRLVRYVPRFVEVQSHSQLPVTVSTPSGEDHPINSPALKAEHLFQFGESIELVRLNRGCFDTMPVSLISTRTLDAIGAGAGLAVQARRFRPNLVVEPLEDGPSPEDGWLGGLLVFGEGMQAAALRLNRQNERCAMINVDPDTAAQTPEVLKHVTRDREKRAGVYGSTERPGTIQVGDVVHWMER